MSGGRRLVAAAVLVAAALGCAARETVPGAGGEPARDAGPYAQAPEVVADSMLRFPGGVTYAPRIYGLEYVATARDAGGAPVLVLSGAECYECDAPRAVYFRDPRRPLPPPEADTLAVYAYPGPVTNPETRTLVVATTLFHGECLEGRGPVALQYAASFEDGAPRLSANLTELAAGGFRDHRGVPRPDSAAVLARVAAGRCREVPPAEQIEMP